MPRLSRRPARARPSRRAEAGPRAHGSRTHTDKAAVVTGSSRGLGLRARVRLRRRRLPRVHCARGEERLAEAALEVEAAARRPNMVAAVQADVSTADGVARVIEKAVETFGGPGRWQQRRTRRRRGPARHVGCRLAGGIRRDAVPGDSRVASRRTAPAPARRRIDRDDRVDFRARPADG